MQQENEKLKNAFTHTESSASILKGKHGEIIVEMTCPLVDTHNNQHRQIILEVVSSAWIGFFSLFKPNQFESSDHNKILAAIELALYDDDKNPRFFAMSFNSLGVDKDENTAAYKGTVMGILDSVAKRIAILSNLHIVGAYSNLSEIQNN